MHMRTRLALLATALTFSACADVPTRAESIAAPSAAALAAQSNMMVDGEVLYGLTATNELVSLEGGKPNQTTDVVSITGLAAGETVIGIDFRPSDTGTNGINEIGSLYAVTTASRLYKVDPATGAATLVATLSIALNGTAFGVGFNPEADRLRIHSNTNQNLRINVETGATILDGTLAYTAGDVNEGDDPDLTATGYTKNDAIAGNGTDLFAIDAAQDVLVTFGPAVTGVSGPNTGKLVTVGVLGVDAGMLAGFDISNATGIAYAVLGTSPSEKSVLYTIDLATGAATRVGLLAQTSGALIGLAVKP
jgi:hypothetical protein